jgi:hypothetical protein
MSFLAGRLRLQLVVRELEIGDEAEAMHNEQSPHAREAIHSLLAEVSSTRHKLSHFLSESLQVSC